VISSSVSLKLVLTFRVSRAAPSATGLALNQPY
jgi:hypothetical protein